MEGYTAPTTFTASVLPAGRWQDWSATTVCRELTVQRLRELRRYFWDPELTGVPAVFKHAASGEESVVFFACVIANSPEMFMQRNELRQTLLHVVTLKSSAELVKAVLSHNKLATVTYDVRGSTPYHYAAERLHPEVMRMLCGYDSPGFQFKGNAWFRPPVAALPSYSIGESNDDGETPIHILAEHGNTLEAQECMGVIFPQNCLDLSARRAGDGYTPLHIAVKNGDEHTTTLLLLLGARAVWRDANGISVLQACQVRAAEMNQPQRMYDLCAKYTDQVDVKLHLEELQFLDDQWNYQHESDGLLCKHADEYTEESSVQY